tara:strand:- start:25930 stop:26916 length:987 start_codon:yes stop_codon:yes gene_type:complete
MQTNETLPIVDLGAFLSGAEDERQEIAARVDDVCQNIGFLIIENHGMPQDIKQGAWKAAKTFFDQPLAEKMKAYPDEQGSPRGYLPIEGETLGKTLGVETPPDRKETFSVGPFTAPANGVADDNFQFFYGDNIWPDMPVDFKENWISYYKSIEKLGANLMELLAVALGLEQDYFVKYHTHHISALRCQSYPELHKDSLPGQLRAGEHTDYGTVTILNPDPNVGGLEVKSKSGTWIKAPLVNDAFIINIGDMMARWTNDRWVSTLHRVVDPVTGGNTNAPARQSIAYFMNPNYDANISAVPTSLEKGKIAKYKPVEAGKYLMDKFNSSL